ncbi:TPA: O-antigen polysaccharide polymerase Wzy [Legionella pneumophila]
MLTNKSIVLTAVWSILVTLFYCIILISSDNIWAISVLLSIGSISITLINWYVHNGGINPSFIFLTLGTLFLSGQAIPVLLGYETTLGNILLENQFQIATDIVIYYAALVLSSFLFVHLGSLSSSQYRVELENTGSDARIYFRIFLLFLPLYLYKNFLYFQFIMSHNGYLSIYQSTEHIEMVGIPLRIAALLCLVAFTLYFYHESDQSKSRWSLIFFIVIFSSEIVIGLRGKFFVTFLIFLLFYKVRFNRKFTIRELLILLLTCSFLALLVIAVREQKDIDTVMIGLIGFFIQQGVTANMNLLVLNDPSYYFDHSWSYFWHQLGAIFYHQTEVPGGWYLANDISQRTMPMAYSLGFGTGSSYISELFLIGGWPGICLGSFIIGRLLRVLGCQYQGVKGAVTFWGLCGLVYYPRTMLQEPVHNLLRYAIPTLLIASFCWMLKQIREEYQWA